MTETERPLVCPVMVHFKVPGVSSQVEAKSAKPLPVASTLNEKPVKKLVPVTTVGLATTSSLGAKPFKLQEFPPAVLLPIWSVVLSQVIEVGP
jgi:hypothetical protein